MNLAYNLAWTQPPKQYAHGPDMVKIVADLWGSSHLAMVKFKKKVTTGVDVLVGIRDDAAVSGTLMTPAGPTDFSLVPSGQPITANFWRDQPKVKKSVPYRFEIKAAGLDGLMDSLAISAGITFYEADGGAHGQARENNHYLLEVENLVAGEAEWLELRMVGQREVRGLVVTKFEFKFPHQTPGRMTCAGTR